MVRLAFNLYTDGTPSVDDYKSRDEQVSECREYSVSDIFCCSYKEQGDKKLPELSEGMVFEGVQTKVTEHFTQPPKHFTEDGVKLITVPPDAVKSPKLTADWENALTLVAKGESTMRWNS